MKKFIGLLVIGFVIGGFALVWQIIETVGSIFYYGVITIFSVLPKLPTNIFDIIEDVIANNWWLTNVQWIDIFLLNVASIIPPLVTFLITKLGLKANGLVSGIISLVVFLLVLQLFSSILFWMFVALIMIVILAYIIFGRKKGAKSKIISIVNNEEKSSDSNAENKIINVDDFLKINLKNKKCPWCGSELVQRNGPFGYFWGCSSYPKCNYSRKDL